MTDENMMTAEEMRLAAGLAHNEKTGGSRAISYGDLTVIAPVEDIRRAVEWLQTGNHSIATASVNDALVAALPAIRAHTASEKTAMEFAMDVATWFANEVIEGRAMLEIH